MEHFPMEGMMLAGVQGIRLKTAKGDFVQMLTDCGTAAAGLTCLLVMPQDHIQRPSGNGCSQQYNDPDGVKGRMLFIVGNAQGNDCANETYDSVNVHGAHAQI